MPFDNLSVCQRFRNGVEALAAGTGSLQQRLNNAFAFQLSCLRQDEIPVPLRDLFGSVEVYLTRREAHGDEGTIAATTESLSDEHAILIAKSIVELSYKLENWPED